MDSRQRKILFSSLGIIGGGLLLSSFTMKSVNKNFGFDKLLIRVLKWEAKWKEADNEFGFVFVDGGYSNHPNDKGGETSWGVTKKYYPQLDIKNLTFEQAKVIYLNDYWKRFRCELLPTHLRYIFFDCIVNQGGNFATKLLQKLGNTKQDGIIGPLTIAASKKITAKEFAYGRIERYLNIIENDPTQAVFKEGWMNRIYNVLEIQQQLSKPIA